MKQWLGVGDPEPRHKSEELRTKTRNQGPGTITNTRLGTKNHYQELVVNNNFESQNQEPKKEDK